MSDDREDASEFFMLMPDGESMQPLPRWEQIFADLGKRAARTKLEDHDAPYPKIGRFEIR